ncbi:MAG: hypothetical protein Q4C58_14675 [Eubacteriales bacterium]|nr:hypothetical protein [Eubacteriales bacterium]
MNEHNNQPSGSRGFATASLMLGIVAFVSALTMTILPPLIFGSLSIILGILSRGSQKKMGNYALAGAIVSGSALILNLAICIFSFYTIFSSPEATSQYFDSVNETYETLFGVSLDDILESYGIDSGQFR